MHLRLIRKIVDFQFVIIEFFLLVVMTEALRANIDWKSALLKGIGQFQPIFHIVWDIPCKPFLHR